MNRLLVCISILLASSTALGQGLACPRAKTTDLLAIHYRLFSAYTIGFDGNEVTCDAKCFAKEDCRKNCQSQKGLEFLAKQMNKVMADYSPSNCETITTTCLSQCQELGTQCKRVCGG